MPSIRLYSRPASLDEKRWVTQRLLPIAARALSLAPDERKEINIQFVTRSASTIERAGLSRTVASADVVVEVCGSQLTAEQITAFADAAAPMLSASPLTTRRSRFARMLGIKADPSNQVSFQFKVARDRKGDQFAHQEQAQNLSIRLAA